MTVRINKPALNLREELTKAQGVVRYEQRQFWMDGLVENGTFDSDVSGWSTTGSGWVYDTNNVTNTTGGNGELLFQNINTVAGKTYALVFDIVAFGGGTAVQTQVRDTSINGTQLAGIDPNTTGTKTLTFTAISNTTAIRFGDYFTSATLDNVQVFEVDENDNVIHSVPLGFKPVHVYEDGLLQREGDVHDYTVVKTGGAYAIKPAVQPTGATETCVIAEREL